jgi:hypothetical protein
MVMGKLGAFLNKDLGALAKDAGKVLNTDLGTIAKGAGRMLQTDLGDLLRDAPAPEAPAGDAAPAVAAKPVAAPAGAKRAAAVAPAVAPARTPIVASGAAFDMQATQKLPEGFGAALRDMASTAPATAAPAFDPDVTQKMEQVTVGAALATSGESKKKEQPPAASPELGKINPELLSRAKRVVPAGNEIKVLLPYDVSDFERPHATPSGSLTGDPVTAVYAGRGETIVVQLALFWDGDEAMERLAEVATKIGTAGRTAPDLTWVIGQTPQGAVFAWTRDCYFFCATSTKGAPPLERFLFAYPY